MNKTYPGKKKGKGDSIPLRNRKDKDPGPWRVRRVDMAEGAQRGPRERISVDKEVWLWPEGPGSL